MKLFQIFKRKKENNKGVAMVTVLITITFLGILATSLMYMAYMNYLTKVVRQKSTDNFYTDEMALDEIAVTLQQMATDASTSSIDASINKIKLATGITGSTYDPSKLADLCVRTKSEGCTVTVTSDTKKVSVAKKGIIYHDVKITTDSVDGDFTNTITTDICLNFITKPQGNLSINEFSIISDDYLDVWSGSQVFEGNLYLENKNVINRYFKTTKNFAGNPHKYTSASQAAQYASVWIHGTAQRVGTATITSPYAIFVGDIVLQDQTSLNIAGNIAVFGNIIVNDGCFLSVTGSVKVYGEVYASDKNIIGKANISTGALSEDDWRALPTEWDEADDTKLTNTPGMTGLLYADYYVHHPSDGKWYGQRVDMSPFIDQTNYDKKQDTAIAGIKYNFGNGGSTVLHEGDLRDSLTILYTKKDYQSHGGDFQDCTIITKWHIYQDSSAPNNDAFTGHMLKKNYDAAYYTTFQPNHNQFPMVTLNKTYSGKQTKQVTVGGTTTSVEVDVFKFEFTNTKYTSSNSNDAPAFRVEKFKDEKEWLEFVDKCLLDSARYEVFMEQDSERYYVYDKTSKQNILPFGYLLAYDADNIIAGVFGCLASGDDPSNNYITYRNWIKD